MLFICLNYAGDACPASFIENPASNNGFCYYVNPALQLIQEDAAQWCIAHGAGSTLGSIAVSATF